MLRHLSSPLMLVVMTLMGVGLVQVYSSSYIFATETYGNGLYFFYRQFIFCLLGLLVLVSTSFVSSEWLKRWGWLAWFVATLLILLTFVPGIGVRAGGAARWIQTPFGFRIEPSELLKAVFALFVACLFVRKENWLAKMNGFFLFTILLVPILAVLKQPDFGTFLIILTVASALLFAMGLKRRVILALAVIASPLLAFLVVTQSYRMARISAFMDPWADPERKGFQLIQSMLSFSSGKLLGSGLGEGQGKLFFLPEAHTDFTLAVLGEELGFMGFFLLMSLYGFLIFKAFQIALNYGQDRFRQTLALGLGLTFALNVFINVGVVLGMLPTKGLTLPFLSYGGSSLIVLCFMFGVLVSLEREFTRR